MLDVIVGSGQRVHATQADKNDQPEQPGDRTWPGARSCSEVRRLPRAHDAGTKGVQGPNLDLAFMQSIRDGLGRSTIEGVVRKQIKLPAGRRDAGQPRDGHDADSVAAYVADAIGKSRRRRAQAAGAAASGTAKANAQNVVDIPTDPTGQLAYKFKNADGEGRQGHASQSRTTPRCRTTSRSRAGRRRKGAVVSGGRTSKITANLKPGSYTFYCSVPGHEQAGMKGTLTVR